MQGAVSEQNYTDATTLASWLGTLLLTASSVLASPVPRAVRALTISLNLDRLCGFPGLFTADSK